MSRHRTPADLARSVRVRRQDAAAEMTVAGGTSGGPWRRETFRLPRGQAREVARDWLDRFPRAAYLTEVESWRVLEDGRIEFTMRRLPTAD